MSAATLLDRHESEIAHVLRLPITDRWVDDHDADRRRRPRASIEQTVKLYDPVSGRYFAGHTQDVSDSGLRLELPARVPARAGQTALVYIAASHMGRGLIDHAALIPIRYVWVRRETDEQGERCVCGVEVLADSVSARNAA